MLPQNVNLPLKTVTARMQSCRTVVWALETYGDRLVDVLEKSLAPFLAEGQVMPFETQLELFEKKLSQALDQMVTSDRAYRDQRAKESIFRARRDVAANAVRREVVDLHSALTGVYSEEKLAEIGFARRTPEQPDELLEQASYLAVRLADPDLDFSGARFELQVEGSNLVERLSESTPKLQQAIDELTREERRAEALKLAKDDALSEYNTSFLWIARTVESLLRLADLEEVARRVRPSSRRAGETAQKPEPSEDGETEGEASSKVSPSAAESAEPASASV